MGRQQFSKYYMQLVIAAGAVAFLVSIRHLPIGRLDLRFLLLALLTVSVTSRFVIRLPRASGSITVTDAFVFLTLLLYGGEAAVLLAATEGACAGMRVSRKPITVLFNAGAMACATFITASVLVFMFGEPPSLHHQPLSLALTTVCTMALVQYIGHTVIVSIGLALKTDEPVWQTWTKHYLWSSVTYFGGAVVSGAVVGVDDTVGFYSLILTVPVVCIIYYTYARYVEDIKATAAKAEQAERERAEQAERHVEELNRYIAELESIRIELQQSKEHFRHAAFHDALTGLPNRALLTTHLKLAIGRAKRQEGHYFAVLFFDLDRFKNINDSLGHGAGDQLLIAIARRVEDCLRPTDTVARLGGDEYAILLDGLEDFSIAVEIAERLQNELAQPFNLDGQEVYITASIGIALSTSQYEHPEGILRDADTAMYRAKEKGKARYELFDTGMHTRAVALLRLENDLRRAVERCEFRVHYQPIVSLENERVVGFEALVRWYHPERGFVPPSEFIPLAEETGLVADIDQWVLRESCRQVREWQNLSPSNRSLTLSANLSSKELTQSDLIERVQRVLADTDFDPHSLKLEITESAVMENADTAARVLAQLRELGVRLSIDDFGTGYSSLSYLHRFPVTTLKIDRSFVSRMGDGDENFEIVRTIMTLASNLGMDTVAEGVETEQQLAHLRTLKCHYGQGYLFSRPLDSVAATALLSQRASTQRLLPARTTAEPTVAPEPITPYIN
ncbi:MAG TPA: EAL domain-containing protein [Pyrinomonadaceae bacterium]|nr:EAL domain-containing protein [Pyrinomonadaceae bacterium]